MSEELFDVLDEDGKVVGKAERSRVHAEGLLHRSVMFFIFDEAGRVFVNKRAAGKEFEGGKWSIVFGGHIASGETADETVQREALEEAGVTSEPSLMGSFESRFKRKDPENVTVYGFVADREPVLDEKEVQHGSFLTLPELEEKIGKEEFIVETGELLKILKAR